jgi:lysophospholipase L1-like esterase
MKPAFSIAAAIKNFSALFIGLLISLVFAETTLRVYNPFLFRIKADKIILPAKQRYEFHNYADNKLDSVIVHTKNSLGFRGPEPPSDLNKFISIIAVGGSTTECMYISDGKDWPNLLGKKLQKDVKNLWINNAGLDGMSTFGHYILIQDYLLKIHPNYILYLVGVNDMGRFDLNEHELDMLRNHTQSFKGYLVKNTELGALIYNFKHLYDCRSKGLGHYVIDLNKTQSIPFDSVWLKQEIQRENPCLINYENRLLKLVRTTKINHIQPVLITQPSLLGFGVDPVTGVNLETVKILNDNVAALGHSGKEFWLLLEKYNDVTRQVAKKEKVILIDLARKLPKSSAYFYDGIHFTNQGSSEVSQIIYSEIVEPITGKSLNF